MQGLEELRSALKDLDKLVETAGASAAASGAAANDDSVEARMLVRLGVAGPVLLLLGAVYSA